MSSNLLIPLGICLQVISMCVLWYLFTQKTNLLTFSGKRVFFIFHRKELYIIFSISLLLLAAFIKRRSTLQRHSFASQRESESAVAVIIFDFFPTNFLPCDANPSSKRPDAKKFYWNKPSNFLGPETH